MENKLTTFIQEISVHRWRHLSHRSNFRKFLATFWDIVATKLCVDSPTGHINWYAVLETKRLLLRPNTTHQIETYITPYMYTLFATSTEHIDRYASTCAHSHTMRARTMRAYANARIRIACERISHASCEHSHTLFGRLPCPLCAHMRAFAWDASAFASHALAFASHALASHANARIKGELMRVRYCMPLTRS